MISKKAINSMLKVSSRNIIFLNFKKSAKKFYTELKNLMISFEE